MKVTFYFDGKQYEVRSCPADSKSFRPKLVTISGHHITWISERGRLFSTRVIRSSNYGHNSWWSVRNLANDLIKLEVITGKSALKMALINDLHEQAKANKWRAKTVCEYVDEIAQTTPITLPVGLRRKLRRLAEYDRPDA